MKSETKVAESIIVRTLKRDTLYRISKFESYLKIILKSFPAQDENEFQLTGELFNMVLLRNQPFNMSG